MTGKQKAALLLMSLDMATATELLKGVDHNTVQELAVELSYLDASGQRNIEQSTEIAKQFCNTLQNNTGFQMKAFLNEMLVNTLGKEKAVQIQTDIQDLLRQKDPFLKIRSIDTQTLSSILENEHPQAAAVVLSELPAKKSSEILGMLGEGIRLSTVGRMTNISAISPEAKSRIAEMVTKRLENIAAAQKSGTAIQQVKPEQSLRKVAVILRNLDTELRNGVIDTIKQKNDQVGQSITDLMVLWEDIPELADRTLQQALRGIDERKLALALYQTDEKIAQKIRSNISERAAAMVDEEASLMSSPKKDEIAEARNSIIEILRDINRKGELAFAE